NTAMENFPMCPECTTEYNDPANRRHYAQTNSCAACGIQMKLFAADKTLLSSIDNDIMQIVVNALNAGEIVAIKGIGGYLLMADAANEKAIQLLRSRKHRPTKPFAVMFPSIQLIEKEFELTETASKLLQSTVAPIVLLSKKANSNTTISTHAIAPGLSKIGVMLPYAPLFEWLLSVLNKPVIATSGNISEASIVYDDQLALSHLTEIADKVLTHNRPIVIPQDDSVVQFSKQTQTNIILRRSRGMAPSYFNYSTQPHQVLLSTGALLKSTCALAFNGNVYVSQYLGNTDSYEAQLSYEQTIQHWLQLFQVQPTVLIADKHPGYFAHQFAQSMADTLHLPLFLVQHHKAHFAAVLAENHLLDTPQKVLGIIWDGVGLGDDGQIWGGEFFIYENNAMNRVGQVDYFPVLLGDKMAKEPRIAALSITNKFNQAKQILQSQFTETEWANYQKIVQQNNHLQCSSMGRLFDAVAALLQLKSKQSYEGEAAMLLEEAALQYFQTNGWVMEESYFTTASIQCNVPVAHLIAGILLDIEKQRSAPFIAAKFHYSLVHLIRIISKQLKVHYIAFSGGVFQNSVLVDWCTLLLSQNHTLFFHKDLSPNDENIAFGQLVYVDHQIDGITMN
ncbi:MAG: carbamoyltransferase HypF, partial [Ferruginibacter sp.]